MVVEVTDDGPGIPADVLSRIFNPFFTTKSTGTGLGLSVSSGIIEDHNGTFEVRSPAGEGATFRITLSVLRAEP